MRTSVVAIVGLLPFGVAYGHHSDANIDLDRVVTLEGTITEWSLRNPHTYFSAATTDESGRVVEWSVQMNSAIWSRRNGWSDDTLAVGDRVRFTVNPSRSGRPYGIFVSLATADGVELPSGTVAERRLVGQRATSIEGKWFVDEASLIDYPGGFDELTRRDLDLNARGTEALAAYDDNSDQNPLVSCIGRPTPGPIIYTDIYPMEFTVDEAAQTIVIRSQFFDNERTVYMDGRGHPPPDQRFHEGHSIGRWEGDALVVDTQNFSDHRSPYQNGIPSGARKHVVERYQLTDGGTRLSVEFELSDPDYFDGTLVHARKLLYVPDMEMTPYDCDVDASRRFLPE